MSDSAQCKNQELRVLSCVAGQVVRLRYLKRHAPPEDSPVLAGPVPKRVKMNFALRSSSRDTPSRKRTRKQVFEDMQDSDVKYITAERTRRRLKLMSQRRTVRKEKTIERKVSNDLDEAAAVEKTRELPIVQERTIEANIQTSRLLKPYVNCLRYSSYRSLNKLCECVEPINIGALTVKCHECGSYNFPGEALYRSRKNKPHFQFAAEMVVLRLSHSSLLLSSFKNCFFTQIPDRTFSNARLECSILRLLLLLLLCMNTSLHEVHPLLKFKG